MADMTQTELEAQGPEGQLNTQSELDPRSIVTFVYRQGNPFMDALAASLAQNGLNVTVRELSQEEVDTIEDYEISPPGTRFIQKERGIKNDANIEAVYRLLGKPSGVIVTDQTIASWMNNIFPDNVLAAYAALDSNRAERGIKGVRSLREMVSPVIEELREAGIEPVILDRFMADHLRFEYGNTNDDESYKEFEQQHRSSDFYTVFLQKAFGLESTRTLKARPDEKKVFLADHHIYGWQGSNDYEIVPICPCCIGLNATYTEKLQGMGYKLYPLKYERILTQTVNRLIGMIDQKRVEIEAQKLSASARRVK